MGIMGLHYFFVMLLELDYFGLLPLLLTFAHISLKLNL